MTEHALTHQRLNDPWLLAVWPGMGNVAMAAGGYLVERLNPQPLFTLPPGDFFDLGQVQVRDGVIGPARFPENRLYGWKHPGGGRDLVIFVGEAQPSVRGYAFCEALLRAAQGLGVRRVVTFASMVTPQHPSAPSRTFVVATSGALVEEVRRVDDDLGVLTEGAIAGLNGTLLAAAAAQGLEGVGIMGEVPQIATNVPYLKAAHAVLRVFSRLVGLDLDLGELAAQAARVEKGLLQLIQQLGAMAAQVQQQAAAGADAPGGDEDEDDEPDLRQRRAQEAAAAVDAEEERASLAPAVVAHIEELFLEAAGDRGRALELKALLDEHQVFKAYEDRFLNLFARPPGMSEPPPS
ncbi:MAG: PAC2 family protein [Planctomycetes bacterium]|nr:PAC2 family protein [Planctomycetota bacterium]